MIKGLLSTIWFFCIPKTPLDVINVYPTTLLSAVHYFLSRNRLNAMLIGLAILWDMSVGFWLMVSALNRPSRSLLRTLMDLKDCIYSPIELARFVSGSRRTMVERESLLECLKRAGLPWNHERDVSIYRVEMGPSCAMISGLATFNIPFLGAVLLIRDDPDQAEASERFAFWHEVGHTLGAEFALQSLLEKGVKGASISIVLSLLLLKWSMFSAAIVVMTFVSILMLWRAYFRLRRTHRLNCECGADAFAVQLMDPSDREELRKTVAEIVPDDGELTESQRVLRRSHLQSLLKCSDQVPMRADSGMGEFIFDAILASLSLVGWMALLAQQFRPVQARDVTAFFWGVLGFAVLSAARYFLSYWHRVLSDMILLGSRCWRDGQFRFGTATGRSAG